MDYSKSVLFQGDTEKLLAATVGILSSVGMRIVAKTPTSITADNPNPPLPGIETQPLLWVDRIHLDVTSERVLLEASWGSMEENDTLEFAIPTSVLGFIGVVAAAGLWIADGFLSMCILVSILGILGLFWCLASGLKNGWNHTEVDSALDTLLSNIIAASQTTYSHVSNR